MKHVSAFVNAVPLARRSQPKRPAVSWRVPHHPSFLHHHFRIVLPFTTHAHPHASRHPIAVQARPISGDSDGEVRDQVDPSTQMNFSVAVTIVSDCDARLRRPVTERIVAEAAVGRIVVVTTAGITATDETDGLAQPAVADPLDQQQHPATGPATDEQADAADPVEPSDDEPVNGVESLESTVDQPAASAVDNLGGWISCSTPEEMVEVVLKLSASKECDYIIAECSADGSIEPQELARILDSRGGSTLRVDALVSVLDGDTLLQDLSALPAPTDRPAPVEDVETADEGATVGESDAADDAAAPEQQPMKEDGAQRAMTVVKLVENANVIVVRQSSAEQPDQLSRVQSVVSVLNGSASVVPATDETVPVNLLVNTNTYDNETFKLGATWKRVLLASRTVEPGSTKQPALPKLLKEATFLYKARRPFNPQRLYEQIKAVATFTGVIRSTGRFWLANRMDAPLEWNQAGVAATLRNGKPFWAAVPEAEWTLDDEERKKVMSNWDTQHGDRETEIVFVGIDIDKTRLQMLLDGCLLNDEEIVFPNMWENFEDPFVEWVPLIEDEEEEEVVGAAANQSAEALAPQQEVMDEQSMESAASDTIPTSDPIPADENNGKASDAADSQEPEPAQSVKKQTEGQVDADDIPDDLLESISALDVLHVGFPEDEGSAPQPQATDDGSYDEDEAVIASWDGSVADGILKQIPKKGLPVTVVTGFLGSGKTTLLNYILTANHGLRVAVLVNEFGEIDIDSQLVENGSWSGDDEVMQLLNGCICCSINDSFVNSVSKILERSDEVDYLIVETTGVADPVPVINSLMSSDLAEAVRIDGILTVVDAENFDTETHMGSEAALSQVMAADTILLSKTDLASEEKVDQTVSYIRSVRPAARILKSQRGRVPLNLVLDVGVRVADSPAHVEPVTPKKEEGEGHDHESEGHGHDHDHDHEHDQKRGHDHDHEHDHKCDDHDHNHEHGPDCSHESHDHDHSNHLESDGFVTTSFKSDLPLDADLFMERFLKQLPEGVFRAKGLLCFYGYSKRYVFQLSGRRYQFEEDEWPEGMAPGNQLVIIGRDLDLETLRETLETCQTSLEA